MLNENNNKKIKLNKSSIILLCLLFISGIFLATGQSNVVNLKDWIKVEIVSPLDSEAIITIGKEHHEMHEGHHYFIKTWIFDNNGAGNLNYFAFVTPATETRVHAKTILFADTDTVFNIYENCTITDGTPVLGINNDRDSINVAELEPLAAPTVVDVGNLIFSARNGGGRDAVGVSLSGNYEIIAMTNTTYCFEISKQTTADTVIDIDFFWYEDGGPPYE